MANELKSYTLIDYFRAFHFLKEQKRLSAGVQAVYFTILGEFNKARFSERIGLSDRELKALAGLKSVSTVHEAKNILKNHKLINFTVSGGITEYQLLAEHLPNTCRTLSKQQPNDSLVSISNLGLDVDKDKRINQSINQSRARVPIGGYSNSESVAPATAACGNGTPVPILDNAELEKRVRAATEWDEPVEEWLSRLWLSNNGAPVTAELLSYLQALFKRHGLKWLEGLIREAAASYSGEYRISLRYFKGCVERKLKGGDTNVRVAGQRRRTQGVSARTDTRNQGSASKAAGTSGEEPSYNWLYGNS